MKRLTLSLLFFLVLSGTVSIAQAESTALWGSNYDQYFKKYSKRYFGPFFDWRWFKCQAIAESGLNPQAKSRVGALGVMQIMPTTFGEIQDTRPHFESIDEPQWNIAAGIFYTRVIYEEWDRFSGEERMRFTFASYNAGPARVRRALRKAPGKKKNWETVSPFLPRETRRYVQRIVNIMRKNNLPAQH